MNQKHYITRNASHNEEYDSEAYYVMKNMIRRVKSQEKSQTNNKSFFNLQALVPLFPADGIMRNPKLWFEKLDRDDSYGKLLFAYLLKFWMAGKPVSPSLDVIAKEIGCSEKTVRLKLKFFKSVGILDWVKKRRPNAKWVHNEYKISAFFKQTFVRQALSPIFSALCFLSIPVVFASKVPFRAGHYRLYPRKSNIYPSLFNRRGYDMQKNVVDGLKYLTPTSKDRLRRFPDEAITFADKLLPQLDARSLPDKFTAFYKLCEQYCKTHNIAFDVPESKIPESINGKAQVNVAQRAIWKDRFASVPTPREQLYKPKPKPELTPEQKVYQNELLAILAKKQEPK